MSKHWMVALALAAALALGACSKKEEPTAEAPQTQPSVQPEMPASHPPVEGQQGQSGMMEQMAGPREIVVPDDVQATWKSVVLSVSDGVESQDLTVDIGQTATVGDLEITVESFLPSFTMAGGAITSKSNETENPAARLVVKEGGQEIFSGWLFSMYPDAHPFQHEKYGVLLKDFVEN